jgi:Phosphotransferase enzyme family
VANDEVVLKGGLNNAGQVVQVGNTVRRPKASTGVQALLAHLTNVGFDQVPRFHGFDEQGRAIVDFIEGDVDVDTDPVWARDEGLIESVAHTQRRFHEAMATFVPSDDLEWDRSLAWSGDRATVVGHNDLCVSNVVVRNGEVAAFIDFDFAAPTHPLWDVAVALRHWVPVKDPIDDRASREQHLDQVDRFRRYCATYGTNAKDRRTIVEMLGEFLDQGLHNMRIRYEQGLPAYVSVWQAGYPLQNRRSKSWLESHTRQLAH